MDRLFDSVFGFRYSLYNMSDASRLAVDVVCLLFVISACLYIFWSAKTPRSHKIIKSAVLVLNLLTVAWFVLFLFREGGQYLEWAAFCLTPLALFSILTLIALKYRVQPFIVRALEFICALIALEFYAFFFIFGEVIVIHGFVNFA